ncbi:siderophore-interacting protein [Acinetobacter puyangensis]|uniref:NADPH-dependent ferric siderophore reductase, contains FAD-binding and SIP domains n=1 Tax=Acinetobacter puyangensis TaxID=1096779 RepID=A0A240E9Z2_9GAMM|nr:siderophore-interacting protein [Acinetobacter puyangensis]SNX44730.1 NADPH-dependent ferric siderophore reductase, contains FAD-binding and SIP domains [Acinetobacter puyangensis]
MNQQTLMEQRKAYRVRHELKFRTITVSEVQLLSPTLKRIVFTGESLKDFVSASFDDHIKMFFYADPEHAVVIPTFSERGLEFPNPEDKPVARDYTPRYFDADQGTLTIDFVLHDTGYATRWAKQAKVGQQLGIGGPRGSMVQPLAFDHYVLIGDDTAIPAIARRLQELPTTSHAHVWIEVESEQDQITLLSAAQTQIHWLYRNGQDAGQADGFVAALAQYQFPAQDFHTWIAAETHVARQLRKEMLEQHGAQKQWTKASGYWKKGNPGAHDSIED